jgi:hypothetical protein
MRARRSPILNAAFRAQYAQAMREEMGRACQLVGLLYVKSSVSLFIVDRASSSIDTNAVSQNP